MATQNIPIGNGNGNVLKWWATLATILATLCVAMFVNWASGASRAVTRDEVNAVVESVRKEASDKDKAIADKLDAMHDKLEDLSLRLEHVDTLLEGRKK